MNFTHLSMLALYQNHIITPRSRLENKATLFPTISKLTKPRLTYVRYHYGYVRIVMISIIHLIAKKYMDEHTTNYNYSISH